MLCAGSDGVRGHRFRATAIAAALFALAVMPLATRVFAAADTMPEATSAEVETATEDAAATAAAAIEVNSPASVLDRIRASGTIRLGYVEGARPWSYRDASGNAAGYSVSLCERIADAVRTELGMPSLKAEWVFESYEQRFATLQDGRADVLCAAGVVTLADRETVAFSIPVFPGSVGALLRRDAASRLKEVLEEGPPRFRPLWRASPTQLLGEQAFAAVPHSAGESFLEERAATLRLASKIVPVDDVAAGVQSVLRREAAVFFADRALLLDAARGHASGRDLVVLDRKFTAQPIALAVPRGDEDVRLLVDRALSRMYRTGELQKVYEESFGEADEATLNFFRMSVLPE